jgi:hypothetical protein
MEDVLQWKKTSKGRQPLMEDDFQWKMTSNVRQTPMEAGLQILKVEYPSKHYGFGLLGGISLTKLG